MARAKRKTWKQLLDRNAPIFLPSAHDALTAMLVERADSRHTSSADSR